MNLLDTPLVIASHNQGKLTEIQQLLVPYAVQVISAKDLSLPVPDETGTSFTENAAIKSEAAAARSGYWSLADDSGLCVEALAGDPGVYSADWAGPSRDFSAAMAKVENCLREKNALSQPKAYFVCVLSLTSPAGKTHAIEGRAYGTLTFPPRGSHGFGYDPIFVPAGHTQTFGEMLPQDKHRLSARGQAFRMLEVWLAERRAKEVI